MNYAEETQRNLQVFEDFKTKFPHVYGELSSISFFVPKGWVKLVETLSKYLEEARVPVLQVKQKFGGLRFYVKDVNDLSKFVPCASGVAQLAHIIDGFETISYNVCESCGDFGAELAPPGYIRTLCRECRVDN